MKNNKINITQLGFRQLLWLALLLPWIMPAAAKHHEMDKNANVADMWVVKPLPGKSREFEAAFKQHVQHRLSQGEKRAWKVYQPVVGDRMGHYVIRFCCTTWAGIDSYRDWSVKAKNNDHWNEHVDDLVKGYRHYFSEVDFKNSNWPEDSSKLKYFEVNEYTPRLGHRAPIASSKKALSDVAKKVKWPQVWGWTQSVGGGNSLNLVFAYENYAAMQPPKKPFFDVVAEHLGSREQAMQLLADFVANFEDVETTVYVLRDDLSVKPGK